MSVIVAKDKEVTVVTITANIESVFPPLWQILGAFCYSPACCSVKKGLMETCITAVLGTIQIMVGLMFITVGPGQLFTNPQDLNSWGAAYWLGAMFIVVGIMSILAGHVPSPCLVGFTVFMNIVSVVFAIVGITLYAIDLDQHYNAQSDWYKLYGPSGLVTQRLLSNIDSVIITLAVIQLFVSFGFVALGIKALVNWKKEEGDEDVEELKKVLLSSPAA